MAGATGGHVVIDIPEVALARMDGTGAGPLKPG